MLCYETPRLTLRQFRDEDIAPLYEIMGDADAMQNAETQSETD